MFQPAQYFLDPCKQGYSKIPWAGVVWVAILLYFSSFDLARSQHLRSILRHPDNIEDLRGYHRDRLLQISYTVRRKGSDDPPVVIYGSGFVVSNNGWAFSASHVLAPAFSNDYEQVGGPAVIRQADGLGWSEPLQIVARDVYFSKTGDAVFFRLTTPTGAPLSKYFCVDRSGDPLSVGSKVTIASWRYYQPDDEPAGWYYQYKPSKDIEQKNGPGGLYEYLALADGFERSMSGGAILLDGKVIAIISTSLMDGGRTVADGNYGYPINATDLPWRDRAADCGREIEGEEEFVQHKNYDAFFGGTCEGALAWIPAGRTRQFYGFADDGTYRMNRRFLACDPSVCKRCGGPKSEKTVRLVLNHRSPKPRESSCSTAHPGASLIGKRTYFGVQILPIYQNQALSHLSAKTEFYRNATLARRSLSGRFDRVTKGKARHWDSVPMLPSEYSRITRKSSEAIAPQCRGLDAAECKTIAGIDYFDEEVEGEMQWHGYPRTELSPRSTLSGQRERRLWSVPDHLVRKQDLHVKNWILRYGMSDASSSNSPVDFAFCVDADWDRFIIRAFAPERSGQSVQMEVVLDQ